MPSAFSFESCNAISITFLAFIKRLDVCINYLITVNFNFEPLPISLYSHSKTYSLLSIS